MYENNAGTSSLAEANIGDVVFRGRVDSKTCPAVDEIQFDGCLIRVDEPSSSGDLAGSQVDG